MSKKKIIIIVIITSIVFLGAGGYVIYHHMMLVDNVSSQNDNSSTNTYSYDSDSENKPRNDVSSSENTTESPDETSIGFSESETSMPSNQDRSESSYSSDTRVLEADKLLSNYEGPDGTNLNDDDKISVASLIQADLSVYGSPPDDNGIVSLIASNIPLAYQTHDNFAWDIKRFGSDKGLTDGESRKIISYGVPELLSDANGTHYYKIPMTYEETFPSQEAGRSNLVQTVTVTEKIRYDSDWKIVYWSY